MTTICTDGRTMAGDSACTGHGTLHCEVKKLSLAKDGSVIGVCGTAFDIAEFVRWYDEGREKEPILSEDFEALVLNPDGTIWCFNYKGRCFIHQAPAAAGSGAKFAYGALEAGVSPEKAVEIACRRDIYSKGPIWTQMPVRKEEGAQDNDTR